MNSGNKVCHFICREGEISLEKMAKKMKGRQSRGLEKKVGSKQRAMPRDDTENN